MKKAFFAAVVVIMLACAVPSAQQAAPPKPAGPKYTEIKYSADASSYRWDGEDRILVLTGNVRFTQGDTALAADKVDYRESTKSATATGNLKVYDGRSTITGEKCTVSFRDKSVSVTGNVHMVSRPKPKPEKAADPKPKSLKSEWKDEVTITCGSITYFYKDKKAIVPTPLTIVQKNRVMTADSATFLGDEELVHLVGNVKGRDDKDGHSFSAPRVTVSLRENDEWVEAEKATGSFYVKEEEEEQPE